MLKSYWSLAGLQIQQIVCMQTFLEIEETSHRFLILQHFNLHAVGGGSGWAWEFMTSIVTIGVSQKICHMFVVICST